MAFFSIIIPVYNVAPYLRECLESVLAQSFTDWECICIDDGSTDGSGEILDAYAAKDARFKVFHQANAGVSSARNFALQQVRGEYVTFVDGDDCLESEWFASAAAAIEEHHPDMVRQGYKMLYPNGVHYDRMKVKAGIYRAKDAILHWGPKTFLNDGYACIFFVKRELLKGLTFDATLKVKEDCIFDLHLLLRLTSVVQTSYTGYLYRQRSESAVHHIHQPTVYAAFVDAALAYWKKYCAIYEAHGAKRVLALALILSIHLDLLEWIARYGVSARRETYQAISSYHHQLRSLGMLSHRHLHFHWILAYYLYLWLRMAWPVRWLTRITRWRKARIRRALIGE